MVHEPIAAELLGSAEIAPAGAFEGGSTVSFTLTYTAGLHGIENELELAPAFQGNMYEAEEIAEVPKTLRAALQALDESAVMRAALGDKVVEHYLHAGNWEQAEYDRRVTDWEVVRNFERA